MKVFVPLLGELKQWYGTDIHIRLQRWLEPTILQTKISSFTTQQCYPFQEEEDTETQRSNPYVPILLTWEPR